MNDESLLEEYACPCAGPQEVLLRIERDRMIQRAIANVPLKFRSALVLKDIEGLSYIEISGILRCSIGTVESKIYRARQFLKKELASLEVDMV